MDRETRQRHARQERIGVFALLLAGVLVLFVATLIHRDWRNVALSGLLVLAFAINLIAQIRRRI